MIFWNFKVHKILLSLILVPVLLFTSFPVNAQENELPTYVVQTGDNLFSIAAKFGVTQQELIDVNELINPDVISAGQILKIPGLEGIQGVLTAYTAGIGEDIHYLTQYFRVEPETFIRLNRLSSANEIYAGSTLIVPISEAETEDRSLCSIFDNNLLHISATFGENPWKIKLQHQKYDSRNFIFKNMPLVTLSGMLTNTVADDILHQISIDPLPLIQGSTVVVRISISQPTDISGFLGSAELHFFPLSTDEYIALQGISAIAETGLLPLEIVISSENNSSSLTQNLLLLPMSYFSETLQVDPITIDPAVVKPEEELIRSIVDGVTQQKYWNNLWVYPTLEPDCIYSKYGNRRTYNGSDYTSFHAGIDYSTCYIDSLDIYAAADGKVVYTGLLTVRGYTTFVDHGWGVFSGYFHQAEVYVKEGDIVSAGQLIGKIGDTGRVTGPHLHFEVWVNGAQVNPVDWLTIIYP